MLGIDIASETINIVHLRRRGGHFVLQEPMELHLEPAVFSDPFLMGQELRQALERRGWQSKKAVITLPRRLCFVRSFSAEAIHSAQGSFNGSVARSTMESLLHMTRDSLLLSADQLMFDLWSGAVRFKGKVEEDYADKSVLLGAAQKFSVEFYREMAATAGLKSPSLELRSLAAVNGLLFDWYEAKEDHIAVVYVEPQYADVAFLDSEGLVSLQSLGINAGQGSGPAGMDELARQLKQTFNASRLTDSLHTPERLFLSVSDEILDWDAESLAQKISRKLQIEVTPCSLVDNPLLQVKKGDQASLDRYVPAVGAALDGLSVSPTWFNFFHPRGVSSEKKRHISWKPFVFLIATIFILLMAFWGSLVQQKLHHLNDIQKQIGMNEPELARIYEARDSWNLFRSYISAQQSGSRLDVFSTFYEISNLCPDPNDAYMNTLEISGKDGVYSVKIVGKVREDKIVTNFIESLNNSRMFREAKLEGPITTETNPENPFYPLSFSVTYKVIKGQVVPKP